MSENRAQSTRKGQYFSFDAMVSVIIFVLAVSLLTSYWFGVRAIMDAQSDDIAKDALRLSDSLIGPGNPTTWAEGVAADALPIQVGLCTDYSSDVLNEDKLVAFRTWSDPNTVNYNETKTRGLRISNDFYVNITDSLDEYHYAAGKAPPAGIKNIIIVRRVVAFNGSDEHGTRPMSLNIYLWNNRTIS